MVYGDLVSWLSGLALMFFGSLALIAYRPFKWQSADGPAYLQKAIFLGFLAAISNTLYWQVLGQPLVVWGWISVSTLRAIGDWLDLLFKGVAGYAGYLHLKALHTNLSEDEQPKWHPIEMPFYPHRRYCLRMIKRFLGDEK